MNFFPRSSTGKADISTIGRKTPTDRRDDENGRCNTCFSNCALFAQLWHILNWQNNSVQANSSIIVFDCWCVAFVYVSFSSQLPFIFTSLKSLIGFLLSSILIMIWTIFPVCLCLGTVLPCCFNTAEMKGGLSSCTPGQIYAVNLFAAVAGCIVGGIVIVPFLNFFSNHAIYLAFILSSLVLLITGIISSIPVVLSSQKMAWITTALSVLLCLTIWALVTSTSYWNASTLTAGLNYLSSDDVKAIKHLHKAVDLPLLFYKEGLNSTVSIMTNPKLNVICLKTDGQMEAALPLNSNLPAASSDEKTQIMLGFCPSFLPTQPENVFLLGYGTGITARSILLNPCL